MAPSIDCKYYNVVKKTTPSHTPSLVTTPIFTYQGLGTHVIEHVSQHINCSECLALASPKDIKQFRLPRESLESSAISLPESKLSPGNIVPKLRDGSFVADLDFLQCRWPEEQCAEAMVRL